MSSAVKFARYGPERSILEVAHAQHAQPTAPSPQQNHLLAALPEGEYEYLSVHLELVPPPLGMALYEPEVELNHVNFPTTAIASLL